MCHAELGFIRHVSGMVDCALKGLVALQEGRYLMSIRAAFFDVDGTLFSHETGVVPESARRALEQLRERGIIVGVATGRTFGEMQDLPTADMPFDVYLTMNGQLILDADGTYIAGNPLTGDALVNIIRLFDEGKVPVQLFEQNRSYINFVNETVEQAQAEILTPVPKVGTHHGAPLYQADLFVDEAEAERLMPLLQSCDITRWNDQAIDVNAPSPGGKADGIARFIETQGIQPCEVIAFGDAENDLSMLQFVGIGVAMGNATPEAKAAASLVTKAVDDDGVAHALKQLGLM